MNSRFCLVAVLLLLDAVYVHTDGKLIGNHISSKKKKTNPTKVGTNPFLQQQAQQPFFTIPSSIPDNPFLQYATRSPSQHEPNTSPSRTQSTSGSFYSSNPFLSGINTNINPLSTTQTSYRPAPNMPMPNISSSYNGNPFLTFGNIDTRVNPTPDFYFPTSAPSRPSYYFTIPNTPAPFTPSFYFTIPNTPAPNTPAPNTPAPNTPAPNTPAPFTPGPGTPLPQGPIKIKPGAPSLFDLEPFKLGPSKRRSEIKCEEYTREIAGTTEIITLGGGGSSSVITTVNTCADKNTLVTGGITAEIGEFPHMVALGKRDSDGTFVLRCGGSLISHTWVLSAAHCTYGTNVPTDALLGIHRLTDVNGTMVVIKNMTRHPDYHAPAMYADIALIELSTIITFNTFIRPACLHQQFDVTPRNAWVSGWGVSEFGGEQMEKLQKAQLDLIGNLACTVRLNFSKEVPHGVTPNMICAGDPHGGWVRDTCLGDSGGPLQILLPNNKCLFHVLGITSFGEGCAGRNSPGVYTRVSHYLSWVEDTVWPQGQ